MVEGKPPFQAEYLGQLTHKILNENPEPMKETPQWVKEIVLGCLSKRKEKRWQSISTILEMLTEKGLQRKLKKNPFKPSLTLPPIEIIKETIKGLKQFTTKEIVEKTGLKKETVEKNLEILAVKSNEKGKWYTKNYWEELKQTAITILETTKCSISNLSEALGIPRKDTETLAISTGYFKKCENCGKIKPKSQITEFCHRCGKLICNKCIKEYSSLFYCPNCYLLKKAKTAIEIILYLAPALGGGIVAGIAMEMMTLQAVAETIVKSTIGRTGIVEGKIIELMAKLFEIMLLIIIFRIILEYIKLIKRDPILTVIGVIGGIGGGIGAVIVKGTIIGGVVGGIVGGIVVFIMLCKILS